MEGMAMTLDAGYICIARASFFYNIKKRTGKYFLILIVYILSSVVCSVIFISHRKSKT